MDGDGGGLRAPEHHLAGLCAVALANGDVAVGQD